MSVAVGGGRREFSAEYRWAGYLLGFAIGGFFDGILLHQILQWHHLLSGLGDGGPGDLRFQILADGLFHLMMYVLLLLGLWLLWRARATFSLPPGNRLILGNALIGFGAWHILDGILSHWVLGIHRIRMDSAVPLFWDLLWFFLFGVVFVLAGLFFRSSGSSGARNTSFSSAALSVFALVSGAAAALPPADNGNVLVVFRPGVSPAQALSAVTEIDGRLIWSDKSDQLWAIALPRDASVWPLYRNGALLVSGSPVVAGCLNWFSRTEMPSEA
ncbi:DUF2243 domain-containing protein [Chelativorans sp. J32]|uniref:DUF2243 domain-containing protein n=1 Tax=Chelativorans sp. J32 TaxID=935840 RepID=UPI000483C09C|nr:DUF2243 domain-containing protein [Chelativorans sp. J32]